MGLSFRNETGCGENNILEYVNQDKTTGQVSGLEVQIYFQKVAE